jgi:2-polyprenyl-3-methyl-5-hydroxy-6-metoxy-1,4-benzoquinol methylase
MNDPRLIRHPLSFWQLRDIPDAETLKSYYAKRYYQQNNGNYRVQYSQEELDWLKTKLSQKLAAATNLRGGLSGTFLDVGCGEGFAMAFFQKKGWTVAGIDYSDSGLQSMNPDMLPYLKTGDVFELLEETAATENKFDLVWLSNVLEHVNDPIELLNAIRKLVSENGVLVVTVPNDGTELQEFLFEKNYIKEHFWIAVPDHISYFNVASLRAITEACGWKCSRIIADFPIDWFLMHSGSNYVAERSLGPKAHRARIDLDLMMGAYPADQVNAFYESMANLGMGRDITAYLQPK